MCGHLKSTLVDASVAFLQIAFQRIPKGMITKREHTYFSESANKKGAGSFKTFFTNAYFVSSAVYALSILGVFIKID